MSDFLLDVTFYQRPEDLQGLSWQMFRIEC